MYVSSQEPKPNA